MHQALDGTTLQPANPTTPFFDPPVFQLPAPRNILGMCTLKRTVLSLFRLVPFKKQLIALGAQLPPRLKCRAGVRFFGLLCRVHRSDEVIFSNIGVSRNYRFALTRHAHPGLLFGRPDRYRPERGAMLLARSLSRECTAFVDVGAYLGHYTFYVRSHVRRIPIFFFEPNGEMFDHIAQNVTAHRLKQITGFKCAVGRCDGQATFYVDLSDKSCSSLTDHFAEKHEIRKEVVDVITFDRFVEANNLDQLCVKVDIENAEFDFAAGARRTMERIRYLIMEVLGPAHQGGFVQMMISRFGFNAYYINDSRLEHSPNGSFTYCSPQYNWLFCREGPLTLSDKLRDFRVISARE